MARRRERHTTMFSTVLKIEGCGSNLPSYGDPYRGSYWDPYRNPYRDPYRGCNETIPCFQHPSHQKQSNQGIYFFQFYTPPREAVLTSASPPLSRGSTEKAAVVENGRRGSQESQESQESICLSSPRALYIRNSAGACGMVRSTGAPGLILQITSTATPISKKKGTRNSSKEKLTTT